MNYELISKYKRALNLANSKQLTEVIPRIRTTLYKIIQPDYIATIDEVIWVECFLHGGGIIDQYDEVEEMRQKLNDTKFVRCSHCGRLIPIGEQAIADKTCCGIYCTILCWAQEHYQLYKSVTVNEDVIENNNLEIFDKVE